MVIYNSICRSRWNLARKSMLWDHCHMSNIALINEGGGVVYKGAPKGQNMVKSRFGAFSPRKGDSIYRSSWTLERSTPQVHSSTLLPLFLPSVPSSPFPFPAVLSPPIPLAFPGRGGWGRPSCRFCNGHHSGCLLFLFWAIIISWLINNYPNLTIISYSNSQR